MQCHSSLIMASIRNFISTNDIELLHQSFLDCSNMSYGSLYFLREVLTLWQYSNCFYDYVPLIIDVLQSYSTMHIAIIMHTCASLHCVMIQRLSQTSRCIVLSISKDIQSYSRHNGKCKHYCFVLKVSVILLTTSYLL